MTSTIENHSSLAGRGFARLLYKIIWVKTQPPRPSATVEPAPASAALPESAGIFIERRSGQRCALGTQLHVVPTKRLPSFNIRATSCNAARLSGTKSSTSILNAPSKE